MTRWEKPGDVLRWWRTDVSHLTQNQAAERLCVQSSALSNWERGKRSISLGLDEVDKALDGGGALAALLWASGTPGGLDAGQLWTKVFPGVSHAVWLWIRADSPTIDVIAEWGVARIETTLELGPNGAFITAGASVPDSPAVVHLSEPGWADFGIGDLPSEIPGASFISAVTLFQRSSADGTFMRLFLGDMASRTEEVEDLLDTDDAGQFFAGLTRAEDEEQRYGAWPPPPEGIGIDEVERRRFARLRSARHLSLIDVSSRLASGTGVEVSRDTLRRFESDVGTPHQRMLSVALDHVLGADGRLAVAEVRSGEGSGVASFPAYWRGPVWLAIEGPGNQTLVLLQRGNWHRELRIEGDALVSIHWFDPSVPLRIITDPVVKWSVGVGRRAGAEPIDQNWSPTTVDTAQQAISDTEQAIFTALEQLRANGGDGGPASGDDDEDEPSDDDSG